MTTINPLDLLLAAVALLLLLLTRQPRRPA